MSILNDCIMESLEKGRYVDIYRDNQSEETIFGRILKVTDVFVCMSAIDDDSFYDGIRIIKKEHITRLRWGGRERNSIERLIKSHEIPANINKIRFESVASVIKSVSDLFGYAEIFVEDIDPDICFIGEITKIDDESCLMHEYGTMRALDRQNLIITLKDVTSISVDGVYERNIILLHKEQN